MVKKMSTQQFGDFYVLFFTEKSIEANCHEFVWKGLYEMSNTLFWEKMVIIN